MTVFSIVVDILMVAVLLIVILAGIKRGFVRSFVGLFKNVAAFLLACLFSGFVGELIENWFVKSFVVDKFALGIANSLMEAAQVGEGADVASFFPGYLLSLLRFAKVDVDGKLIQPIEESIAQNGGTALGIANIIAEPIAHIVSVVIAFALVYFISVLLMSLLSSILDKLCQKLPVVRTANGILGGVFGAVCGVVYLWVAAKILVVLIAWAMGSGLSAFSFLEGFNVENTFVLKLFSNFNPLRLLFTL